MNKNFNVAEILKSVDSIVADNNYIAYDKKQIFNRYKRFTNKKINMSDIPETEKIIIEAEKSLKNKKLNNLREDSLKNKPKDILVLKNEYVEKLVLKDEYVEKLVLKDELIENHTKDEKNLSEKNYIEEENNLKDLENNFVYMNEKLKSLITKQDEKIKDLNILLDKFISQERYKDLDKKIKLYQDDNAALRQKVLNLSDKESNLRLQISDLNLTKKIEEGKSKEVKQVTETENEVIKKLNIIIGELLQKNTKSIDIDQKIKFYREENAKIIVDKSEIERKLENTKNQLAMNENNKKEIKIALNNLNKILAASNIESSTFINKLEDQTLNTNPVVDENKTKKF